MQVNYYKDAFLIRFKDGKTKIINLEAFEAELPNREGHEYWNLLECV